MPITFLAATSSVYKLLVIVFFAPIVYQTRQRRILLSNKTLMSLFVCGQVDTAAVFSETSQKYLGISSTPGTNMAASFGHLAGGYDAQYYGYMVGILHHSFTDHKFRLNLI